MTNPPTYKRGTVTIDGKQYGHYPDGTLYRIYSTADRSFITFADHDGQTVIQVRQATEKGYAECPVGGCVDLSYPNSQLRRARTVGGGQPGERPDLRATACNIDRMGVRLNVGEAYQVYVSPSFSVYAKQAF